MAFIPRRVLRSLGSPLRPVDPYIGPIPNEQGLIFPFNEPSLIAWLQSESTFGMWQEAGGFPDQVALTPTTLNNRQVGQIDDPTPATSWRWVCTTSTLRPILTQHPSASRSGLWFSGSHRIFCKNTSGTLGYIHQQMTGTILFSIMRVSQAGESIFGSARVASPGDQGFSFETQASNECRFRIMTGAAGFAVNHTTSGTLIGNYNEVPIAIRLGHLISGSGIRIGSTGSWENFVMPPAPISSAVSMSSDLIVGDNVIAFNNGYSGSIGNLMFFTAALSDTIIDNFMVSYTPSYTANSMVQSLSASLGYFNYLYGWYDFNDVSITGSLFSASNGTQRITGSTSLVSRINHKLDNNTSRMMRHATIDNIIGQPAYSSSLNGALFNGINNNLRFARHYPMSGGNASWFAVVRNDNTTSGSHILQGGSNYWGVFGANHSSGACHFISISGSVLSCSLVSASGFNIVEVRRSGSVFTMRTNGTNTVNGSNMTGAFTPRQIGSGAIGTTGFFLSGVLSEMMLYNQYLTDTQANVIVSYLNSKYNIF